MFRPTPFFSAFGPLLFGRRPLPTLAKLLRQTGSLRSLSLYQEAFGEFIPQALLAPGKEGANSRQRLFTPVVTFWAFLAQVLERGSSCRDALRRITAWWKLEAPDAPSVSPATGGYCQARQRLNDQVLQQIGTHLADRLEKNLARRGTLAGAPRPDRRWHHRLHA